MATVVVSGEIDVASSPTVGEALSQAVLADGADAVLVDLSAVRFLDSSGISVLLKGRRLAGERAVSYRVTGANDMVRRILELTGVWEHLCGDPIQPAEA
jgi:anti-sigma B factor antagonist